MNPGVEGDDSAANSGDAELQVKLDRARLSKLELEIAQLNNSGWTFDTLAKVAVGVLAAVAAGFAVYNGIPQAKLDLFDAQTKLSLTQKDLEQRQKILGKHDTQIAEQEALLKSQRAELAGKEGLLKSKSAELVEKDALLKSRTAELVNLEAVARTLKVRDPERQKELDSVSKPRVFIHFAGDLPRERINRLRDALGKAGFNAPDAERVNIGQKNYVKYFADTEAERLRAERVKTLTDEAFRDARCPLENLTVRRDDSFGDKQLPLEIWLMHNCRT